MTCRCCLRSEDLHVAPVLTVWNRTNSGRTGPCPGGSLVELIQHTSTTHWPAKTSDAAVPCCTST